MRTLWTLFKILFLDRFSKKKDLTVEELEEREMKEAGVKTKEELKEVRKKDHLKRLRKIMATEDFPFDKLSKVWVFAIVTYSDEILIEIRDSIMNNTFENKEKYKESWDIMKDLLHFDLLELKDGKQYVIAYVDPFDYVNDELLWYYEPTYKVELPPENLIYKFD